MSYGNRQGQAASRYIEQEIRTADPLALVVQVYEIAYQAIKRARAAIDSRDWAAKGRAVNQASRAIDQLQSTLNMEKGGEVARNLDRLYTYFQFELTEAHLHNDAAKLEEIASHVSELLSAWREAAAKQQKKNSAKPAEAASGTHPTAAAGA